MSMRVLLVGANSYIGKVLAALLLVRGYSVSALARTEQIAEDLRARGLEPVRGQVTDVATATCALARHDACIWLSFLSLQQEHDAIQSLLPALQGSGKTFIFTSGTAVLGIPTRLGESSPESFAEDDPFTPPPWLALRRETEIYVSGFALKGVRSMVIRPPMVWGRGGSRQIPWIFETVAKTGSACYVGAGLNAYSHVHVGDLAELYRLAVDRGVPGALYHAVAGEVNFRTLAEAAAVVCGRQAQSVTLQVMAKLVGRTAAETAFAMSSRSRCPRAHAELRWWPNTADVIADITHGSYSARFGPQYGTTQSSASAPEPGRDAASQGS